MEKLLPLWVVLLALTVQAQGPSFYFPDQPHPPSSPQQQGQRSTQEVLGNFFNDNVNLPSITTSQPAYSSPQPQIPQFQPYQPQTFSTGQPPQFNTGFPTQNNYVTNSPPNNRPRQTSFFGNNYDFFRQFHLDAAPHRPSYQIQPFQTASPSFTSSEYDPYRRPNSFDNFGPQSPSFFSSQPQQQQQQSRPFVPSPPQYVARPSPQPQIAVIVTEAAPSPTPATEGPVEVLRVGPKGRLLKKRRKVNKPQQQKASSTTTSEVTTYRPPAAQEQEEDQSDKQKQEPVTTYRSRFRFSTTTSTSPPAPSAAEGGAASSDGADNSQQLIQSRLKSLERQIRFRHRNKNS